MDYKEILTKARRACAMSEEALELSLEAVTAAVMEAGGRIELPVKSASTPEGAAFPVGAVVGYSNPVRVVITALSTEEDGLSAEWASSADPGTTGKTNAGSLGAEALSVCALSAAKLLSARTAEKGGNHGND